MRLRYYLYPAVVGVVIGAALLPTPTQPATTFAEGRMIDAPAEQRPDFPSRPSFCKAPAAATVPECKTVWVKM